MLDDLEHVTGLNRKSITRALNGRISRKKRARERGPIYEISVMNAVRKTSKALDYLCAERLKINLVCMVNHNIDHFFIQNATIGRFYPCSVFINFTGRI